MQYLQKFSLLIPFLVTAKEAVSSSCNVLVTEYTKETEGQKLIKFHMVLDLKRLSP